MLSFKRNLQTRMGMMDIFKRKAADVAAPFMAMIRNPFAGDLGGGRERKYLEAYRNWAFACINARAEAVGAIDLRLFKNGEEVAQHEIMDVLYRVNPSMTKTDLFFGTQAFLDLEGNAFWYLQRSGKDGKGKIVNIYLLRPDLVTVQINKDNPLEVLGYVFQNKGNKVPFAKSEILHIRNFNPNAEHPFPYRGMGIVQAAAWAIDTDDEARKWNYAFFKNNARPDGLLIKEGVQAINAAEQQRILGQFNNQYQGSDKAHKVALLSGGLKWQDLTYAHAEMGFTQLALNSRDEIFALFRTPKSVLGIVEDVNRANAEASNFIFALRTVDPLMRKIVEAINEFLLPEWGDGSLELKYVSPVPEDRIATTAEYTNGWGKWLTTNDIRRKEGLEPTKDGDKLFGAFSLAPFDAAPKPKATKRDMIRSHSRVDAPAAKGDTVKDAVADAIKRFVETKYKRLTVEQRDAYKKVWKAGIDVDEKPLKKDLGKYFDKQEAEVLANLKSEKAITKDVTPDKYLFDQDGAVEASIELITPHLKKFIKRTGGQAMELVDPAAEFDAENPDAKAWIEERAQFFADSINKTTREALFDSLKDGMENGEDIGQLSDRVADVYDMARDYRTDRIARTEVSAASNEAAVEAYEQAGVDKYEWMVVDPQDEDCQANEGEVRAIGDAFPSGAIQPPDDHPNCVCTLLPVLD